MTTLAKDSGSYKASSVKRRDFRRSHDTCDNPEISPIGEQDEVPPWDFAEGAIYPSVDNALKRARKDTKRWCGGHVGREHSYILERIESPAWHRAKLSTWTRLICSDCGRRPWGREAKKILKVLGLA